MAIFIVDKSDLSENGDVLEKANEYCDSIYEDGTSFKFIPKEGMLALFGLFLTDQKITFKLSFEDRFL